MSVVEPQFCLGEDDKAELHFSDLVQVVDSQMWVTRRSRRSQAFFDVDWLACFEVCSGEKCYVKL